MGAGEGDDQNVHLKALHLGPKKGNETAQEIKQSNKGKRGDPNHGKKSQFDRTFVWVTADFMNGREVKIREESLMEKGKSTNAQRSEKPLRMMEEEDKLQILVEVR